MWIKVCGCTDPQNAAAVANAGVTAIGLNFFPGSKRYVGDRAEAVRDAIGDSAEVVGLFVNEPVDRILETAGRLALDSIQLHGDEPPEVIESLREYEVYRAVRVPNGAIAETISKQIAAHQQSGPSRIATSAASNLTASNLTAFLIDAASTRGLGGTGESVDWLELNRAMQPDWPQIVLAGGLSPSNVRSAIEVVRPFGVDVASGVESEPGFKDIAAVERFVAETHAVKPQHES